MKFIDVFHLFQQVLCLVWFSQVVQKQTFGEVKT